jgi:hypothetical protein
VKDCDEMIRVNNQRKRYGFFSHRQLETLGSVLWKTPSGGMVEVTQVRPNPEPFHDEIYMGEVTKFVRKESVGLDMSFVFVPADKSGIVPLMTAKKVLIN